MQEQDKMSRLSSENDPVWEPVKNSGLQCADCAFMLPDNTVECEKYYQKPGYVLYGTKPCPNYVPKAGAKNT